MIKINSLTFANSRIYRLYFFGLHLFIKRIERSLCKQEMQGHKLLKNYYKVANQYFHFSTVKWSYFAYKMVDSIGINRGLLLDLLISGSEKTEDAIKMYRKSFLASKTFMIPQENIFFRDRISSRIYYWYGETCNKINNDLGLNLPHIENYESVSNIVLKACNMIENDNGKHLCVASQCDPSDLNITIDGYLLDYTAGGMISIEAEVASFLCINMLFAEYLSPIYNKTPYSEHNKIYVSLDMIKITNKHIIHYISSTRMSYIIKYFAMLFESSMIKPYDTIMYQRFTHLFVIRSTTIFNVLTLRTEDMQLVYTWCRCVNSFNNYNELVEYLTTYEYYK